MSDVVKIPLTRGLFAVVDADDAPKLVGHKWQASLSRGNWHARRAIYPGGKQHFIWMHRVIMDAPEDTYVDHIDNDGLNNRRSNLRLCARDQNMANQPKKKNNTSGYIGVYRMEGRWAATLAGKYLGLYDTAEEAARAYDTAARAKNGEFASLNFPGENIAVAPRVGGPPRTNSSGHKGVVKAKNGRWAARINRDGQRVHLGYFATVAEAVAAQTAAR